MEGDHATLKLLHHEKGRSISSLVPAQSWEDRFHRLLGMMWSYVQYRRIGQDVEEELKRGSKKEITIQKSVSMSRLPDIENGDTWTEKSPKKTGLRTGFKPHRRQETRDKSEEKQGAGKELDGIVIKVSGENDPIDPKNWGVGERAKNIAILSLLIFVQAWAGGAESIANAEARREFHVSKTAESLSTAMYLFGIGSGALFVGPLSESVGRNPTYLTSTFCYLLFVLGSALTPTFGGQVVCRYFVGLFASATLAVNGASVRDQFRPVKRAFVFPVIAWANVVPPTLASIVGGWVVSNPKLSWRWTEWITLIISGFGFLVALMFLPETYLPVLLRWKAEHTRRITKDSRYVSERSESASVFKRTTSTLLISAKFLVTEPVIAVLGGYLVLLYVLLFTFLSGFDYIFRKTYDLSVGIESSCFAAITIGATTFTLCAPGFYSWARYKTEYRRGAPIKPEFRLWPAIATAPLLPIVLFWLGWTNYPHISIWSGLAACYVFGVVIIAIYVSTYEYIVDSYGDHAAVALSSITMARYLIAGGMVIAVRPMYEHIGVHWTMTMLGCIATILIPGPLIFWKSGHKLREMSPYAKSDES